MDAIALVIALCVAYAALVTKFAVACAAPTLPQPRALRAQVQGIEVVELDVEYIEVC